MFSHNFPDDPLFLTVILVVYTSEYAYIGGGVLSHLPESRKEIAAPACRLFKQTGSFCAFGARHSSAGYGSPG